MRRRDFLTAGGGTLAAGLAARELRERDERGHRSEVFVARAPGYSADLERIVSDGLVAVGRGPSTVRGRSVLLKPNLVEPCRHEPQINTHPAVVLAAAAVFRRWGAREVLVAEGQGHCRDSRLVLDESGLGDALDREGLEFVDLNHDEPFGVANPLRRTRLAELSLPATLRRADLVVSMPKMKTHHWAGVTLSLKNLFGVMPGIVYGWPKNVLHHAGIDESILDIAATVRPGLAIVDGIVGMEGDGPIMGTAVNSGLLVIGSNPAAADATCARLMGIDPWAVPHLAGASGILGPISHRHIAQRGEPLAPLVRPFRTLA